jgi:hypothetical protein
MRTPREEAVADLAEFFAGSHDYARNSPSLARRARQAAEQHNVTAAEVLTYFSLYHRQIRGVR